MRKRFNAGRYEWAMQEWLHLLTYKFLHLPPGNRWYYPDIHLWDETDEGENLIPGLISFYFDPTFHYSWEHRDLLRKQLNHHIPADRWHCYWMFGEGFIWAEREAEGVSPYLPESIRSLNRRAVVEYDAAYARTMALAGENYSQNGHKEIESADDLLMVPRDE